MKKFIYALCLLAAGGMVANAAVPTRTQKAIDLLKEKSSTVSKDIKKAVKMTKEGSSTKRNAKSKAAATLDDFVGNWLWNGESGMSNGSSIPCEGVMTFSVMDNDSILIKGFDLYADYYSPNGGLTGYFKNGRVYIPNQVTIYPGTMDVDNKGQVFEVPPQKFTNLTLRNYTQHEIDSLMAVDPTLRPEDFEGKALITFSPNDFFFALDNDTLVCVQYPEGTTNDDITNELLAQCWNGASEQPILEYWPTLEPDENGENWYFVWICDWVYGSRVDLFEFNPDDWTSIGNASFKDAWLGYDYIDAYPVPAYRSAYNEDVYLLYDPYGPDTPFAQPGGNADPTKEGFLIFDCTDPNCVLVEPFVYSLTFDLGDDDEGLQEMFNYNEEAYYYYIQGLTLARIRNNITSRGGKVTKLDTDNGWLSIYNACFDWLPYTGLAGSLSWNNSSMGGYVVLPGFSGVESIGGENNDAPEVYYNMQGVRINNPEKGQFVIVKKGDKTSKQIIR